MLHLESRSPQALFAPPSPPLLLGRWSRGGGSLLSGAPCIVLSGPCPLHPRCLRLRSALHGKHLKLSVQFSAKGRQTACIGKPSSAFWHTKVPAVLIGKSQSYSRFFFFKSPSRLFKLETSLCRRPVGRKASSGPLSTLRFRARGLGGQVESSKGTLLVKAGTRSADWRQTVGARQKQQQSSGKFKGRATEHFCVSCSDGQGSPHVMK